MWLQRRDPATSPSGIPENRRPPPEALSPRAVNGASAAAPPETSPLTTAEVKARAAAAAETASTVLGLVGESPFCAERMGKPRRPWVCGESLGENGTSNNQPPSGSATTVHVRHGPGCLCTFCRAFLEGRTSSGTGVPTINAALQASAGGSCPSAGGAEGAADDRNRLLPGLPLLPGPFPTASSVLTSTAASFPTGRLQYLSPTRVYHSPTTQVYHNGGTATTYRVSSVYSPSTAASPVLSTTPDPTSACFNVPRDAGTATAPLIWREEAPSPLHAKPISASIHEIKASQATHLVNDISAGDAIDPVSITREEASSMDQQQQKVLEEKRRALEEEQEMIRRHKQEIAEREQELDKRLEQEHILLQEQRKQLDAERAMLQQQRLDQQRKEEELNHGRRRLRCEHEGGIINSCKNEAALIRDQDLQGNSLQAPIRKEDSREAGIDPDLLAVKPLEDIEERASSFRANGNSPPRRHSVSSINLLKALTESHQGSGISNRPLELPAMTDLVSGAGRDGFTEARPCVDERHKGGVSEHNYNMDQGRHRNATI